MNDKEPSRFPGLEKPSLQLSRVFQQEKIWFFLIFFHKRAEVSRCKRGAPEKLKIASWRAMRDRCNSASLPTNSKHHYCNVATLIANFTILEKAFKININIHSVLINVTFFNKLNTLLTDWIMLLNSWNYKTA